MKTIALCSSMHFYKEVIEIGERLEEIGWRVLYPETSLEMKNKNDFNIEHFKKNISTKRKGKLIKLHFKKVLKSDSILVVNSTKNGVKGYIGPNVLMEMGLALNNDIKIYLLNPYPKSNLFYEEIIAMDPTIIKGDISKIK